MRGVARKTNKKKTPKIIKKELLTSILDASNEEEDYLRMSKAVKNAKELKESICLTKKYEKLLKGANKQNYQHCRKQGELLKRLKEEDELCDCVGLSRSNIYFKIRFYKFLCKFPVLKKSTLKPFVLNLSFRKFYEILVYNLIIKFVSD